jgi:uncharacterized cupredoxin-like copper-binding protein
MSAFAAAQPWCHDAERKSRENRRGPMRVWRQALPPAIGIALITLFTACGGGEQVDITLQEFAVGTVPATAAAGSVTFNIVNNGPDDVHEFVVIRTDLDPNALPTDENGAVDETGEGMDVIDEVEEMEPGASETLTVDLEAGSYALICNIYDADEDEAHYSEGMRTSFTVS